MRKSLKFTLLFLFAVFILWFFGRNLDWQQVSDSFRKADATYLVLAALATAVGYLLRAVRWGVLLEPLAKTSLRELFAATTVGFAVIMIVGRAGELARPAWLSMRDRRVRPGAALVTLGVERIFDLAALICFFSVNLLWFNVPAGRESEVAYIKFVGNLLLVGMVFGFAALYFFQKYSAPIISRIEKATDKKFVPRRVRSIFLSILEQLAASLQILKDWREVVSILFWTCALWLTISIPTWLVILAFDLSVAITFSDSLFIMGFAALGSVVPTPGGAAGAFHAATAGGLIFLNVGKEDAAAVSIALHLVYFAPAIFFGFYYFLRGDISLARLRGLVSGEHAAEEIEHETELQVQNSKLKVS